MRTKADAATFFEGNTAAMKSAALNDDQARSPAAEGRRRRSNGMRAKIIMTPHIRAHRDFVNGGDTAAARRVVSTRVVRVR
jgi:hypothetical protein